MLKNRNSQQQQMIYINGFSWTLDCEDFSCRLFRLVKTYDWNTNYSLRVWKIKQRLIPGYTNPSTFVGTQHTILYH